MFVEAVAGFAGVSGSRDAEKRLNLEQLTDPVAIVITPAIAGLMYAMFLKIPSVELRAFVIAASSCLLLANFLFVP